MKLTLGSRLTCPKCGKRLTVETGIFGAPFWTWVLDRLERSGGAVTCACGHKYEVKG